MARHERLSHCQSPDSGLQPTPPSSDQVLDGLNILASAVTERSQGENAVSEGQGPFLSSFSAVDRAVTDHRVPNSVPPAGSSAYGPLPALAPPVSYDAVDFTSFLDSIPLPSHSYSPTYQPLPLFPELHFESVSEVQSLDKGVAEGATTPSSSVLPRHGTQLPSLQPEESPPYRARQPKYSITVSEECRDRIVALLSRYSNVLRSPFVPSRHALSRCLTGYLIGYHDHYPFMHLPTLNIDVMAPQLVLSMAALGARYCREPDTSMDLYQVAKVVTLEHIRRGFQSSADNADNIKLSNASITEHQDFLETIQALVLLHSVSSWFKHDPPYYESLAIQSYTATLLRKGGLNDLPADDGSWESWIRRELVKRTILIAFSFLNILTIVFDTPPLILAEELELELPCTEKEWQAASANQWLRERSQSRGEPMIQDALSSLFSYGHGPNGRLESFSSLGGFVLIHAILQSIWLIQKARRLPIPKCNSMTPSETLSLEQALEQWCQCWEHNQESSTDPFNPHGPLSFTSTALLRQAYIRLDADFTSARQLHTWDPDQIARSLKENLAFQRSDRLTRAALHCAHALSTPIKLGINYVAQTQVVSWSNQYALCSLECAVLLAKWLEMATIPNPEPSLTEQEARLLEFVIEMVMETQQDATREWLLANNARLSAIVTRLWARLFTADYIWELVNLIGRSLESYANILETEPG